MWRNDFLDLLAPAAAFAPAAARLSHRVWCLVLPRRKPCQAAEPIPGSVSIFLMMLINFEEDCQMSMGWTQRQVT